jgi:MFS-type transporter involved in bile tolerance (Atg22 family)
VAAALFSIFVGWASDRYKNRGIAIFASVPLGIIGFFMLVLVPADKPAVTYGAMYLAASGIYAYQPIWLAWVSPLFVHILLLWHI